MRISTIVFITFSFNLLAQTKVNLEINNPEPRVEENVILSLDMDFFQSEIYKKLGSEITFTGETSIHGMRSDNFERVILFNKEGINKIGPIEFNLNGEKYLTNEILVNVKPKLKLEEGLWLRIADFDGKKYLIIEQLIKNIPKTEFNEFGEKVTYLYGTVPQNFEPTSINENFSQSIEFLDKNTQNQTMQPVSIKEGDMGFTYFKESYQVNFIEKSKNKIILTEKCFKNLPEKYKFENIIIQQ